MKKALLAFVALTVLLAVVLYFSLNSIIKNGVESFGSKALSTDVRLESASISFLSGAGEIAGLHVANPEGYPEGDAVRVGRIRVSLDLASLFSEVIVIHEIRVEEPVVNFATGTDGSNVNRLLQNARASAKTSEKQKGEPAAKDKAGQSRRVVVDVLRITGGKVSLSLSDVGARTPDVQLDPIVMRDLGQGGEAVTAAGVFYQVFQRLAGAVFDAALSIGGQAEQLLRQGLDTVKGLFE